LTPGAGPDGPARRVLALAPEKIDRGSDVTND
jgi:hypothetical protein